jgi:hypothetical protein
MIKNKVWATRVRVFSSLNAIAKLNLDIHSRTKVSFRYVDPYHISLLKATFNISFPQFIYASRKKCKTFIRAFGHVYLAWS